MGVRLWRAAIMTAQNFQQIYQELVLLLKEHNLDWVVEQAASIDALSPVDQMAIDPTSDMEGALVEFLGETGNHLKRPLTLGFATDGTGVETLNLTADRYQAIASPCFPGLELMAEQVLRVGR
jgi:hypothetical protein